MEDKVLFSIDQDNIARITLNRPSVHNALDQDMILALINHLKEIRENPSLKALILEGSGESFCAGADLFWMKGSSNLTDRESFEEARTLALMLYFLDTLPIPTLCYVQGAVMGGGIGIVACSDIALSDSKANFGFSEVKLGLVPAIISPYVLRTIGPRYARRYFLTGEVFNASKAFSIGLVHEVIDSKNKKDEMDVFIRHLLSGGPTALIQAKKLIRLVSGDISEDLRLTTIELFASLRHSEECEQGIKAFLDKTTPPWASQRIRDD